MKQLARSITILSVLAGAAGLATAEPVRLDYGAPAKVCPDAGRFRDEVAARVGSTPFSDEALSVVRVRIRETGDGFAGTLETQGAAPRDFRDGQCAAVAETIASALATQLDAPRVAAAAAPEPGPAPAPAPAPVGITNAPAPVIDARWPGTQWVSGGIAFSQIWRTTSASGLRAQLGYDRRVAVVTLGARAGVAKHEDAFGSSTLPYLGVRVFGTTGLGTRAQLRFGGGAELWINSVSETGIMGEPVFLHVLGEVAPRIRLGGGWAVDLPVELGVMPYFDPKVWTLQVGAQAVYSL